MVIYQYRADILPEITFSGIQESTGLWRNIRRMTAEYIFYYVTEGDVYLEEDGKAYHLQTGDCFLLEPGKLHFGTKYSSCRFYYVHFIHPDIEIVRENYEEWTARTEEHHGRWKTAPEAGPFPDRNIYIQKYFHVEDSSAHTGLIGLFEKMLNRQNVRQEYFQIQGAAVLSEIFIELIRQYAATLFRNMVCGAQKTEHINAVLRYLHANYMKKITSEDIEKEVSYNFDYLNQLFGKYLQITIFRLLENIRIEEAEHILLTRPLSVREIAGKVGYTDETYFTRVFKKHTGFTPSQYRKNRERQSS